MFLPGWKRRITFVPQNNDIPTMTDKFKKAERQYVLSDSSLNEYGFRLLTSGYQIDLFQKNPIGYYMHRRDDGIVLKWEDLYIDGDQVKGTPVINLSNGRGEQTLSEVENGFLNAASVGHIVVLEYSMDKELMLPGQTGPTITKWYNKECSLVDIPGNSNALTCLYDAQENVLNLADMSPAKLVLPVADSYLGDLREALGLADDTATSGEHILSAVRQMVSTTALLATEKEELAVERNALAQQLSELKQQQVINEVTHLLEQALEDRKLTVALKNRLAADYADNPAGLKLLIAAMPAYRSITELLKAKADDATAQWEWGDYEHNDPSGRKLKELKANDPVRYRELFERKFA